MKTILLDRVILENLYGDSRENRVKIFSEFLGAYSGTKKALYSAFESGNLTSLRRVLLYHAPSFIYLGLPELTTKFKNLALKCAKADSHYPLAKDFAELMKTLETSWKVAKNEMDHLMNTDSIYKSV